MGRRGSRSQFDATIFGFATFFNGSIANASFENSWQRVDDGDANGVLGDSEQTVILALEGSEVLGDIALDREVFTPNADGINDEFAVRFPLMRVASTTLGPGANIRSQRPSRARIDQ